jgi:hypothetical protein
MGWQNAIMLISLEILLHFSCKKFLVKFNLQIFNSLLHLHPLPNIHDTFSVQTFLIIIQKINIIFLVFFLTVPLANNLQ